MSPLIELVNQSCVFFATARNLERAPTPHICPETHSGRATNRLGGLHEVAPEGRQHDASSNREGDPHQEGVSSETHEFPDILSNTARYAVPLDRGRYFVSRLPRGTVVLFSVA